MPAELQERRRNVLAKMLTAVAASTELENGFIYQFTEGELISELANLIQLEHQCCPFLRFRLTVEPGQGAVSLEMTGPKGTNEFLAEIFGQPTQRSCEVDQVMKISVAIGTLILICSLLGVGGLGQQQPDAIPQVESLSSAAAPLVNQ
jgi:hypothetical protein